MAISKEKKVNTVYIGYDPKEKVAAQLLKYLIEANSPKDVIVKFLRKDVLEHMNMLYRSYEVINNQMIDSIDQTAFSSEFTFSRFLVPALMQYEGWALYLDCDMYPRTDVNEIFEEYNDEFYPLYCVKHNYTPINEFKMDGRKQDKYERKNWSSLILWNCGHKANKPLTPFAVNNETGNYLHTFGWLPNKSGAIGSMSEEWNWLDGHSSKDIDPKIVHFTTGGPWFPTWKCSREVDGLMATEWNSDYAHLTLHGKIDEL
tara:strand:+ start:1694 stop:2470 length:777 start_codon:yes stop_codon:yes gene_type:complete